MNGGMKRMGGTGTARLLSFLVPVLLAAGCGGGDGTPADPGTEPGLDPGLDEGLDVGLDEVAGADATDATGEDAAVEVPYPELDPEACLGAEPPDLLGYDRTYGFPAGAPVLEDKAFFLLAVLQQVSAARDAIGADAILVAASAARVAAFRTAAGDCAGDAECLATRLEFGADEAGKLAGELARVLAPTGVVASHLRPSGRFALHAALDDEALVQAATKEALSALDAAFDGRARGRSDLADRVAALSAAHPGALPFYEPLLEVVLDAVSLDGRDEATRYEPLDTGENAAALARLDTLDWKDWRFAAILVPGWGPEDYDTPLSAIGRDHCDISVKRLQAGVAPFLLLSGGHVHPDRTPYSEAIEMKKFLKDAYGVRDDQVLVDPYARHTTTNLRNAARILLRAGVPADKPVLISTDALQLLYISALGDRCNEELGYVPYRFVRLLSEEDGCFLPDARSLHADARDLLDP